MHESFSILMTAMLNAKYCISTAAWVNSDIWFSSTWKATFKREWVAKLSVRLCCHLVNNQTGNYYYKNRTL